MKLLRMMNENFQVALEQLTSSPWNNMLFMIYYGVVVESKFIAAQLKSYQPLIHLTWGLILSIYLPWENTWK